MNEIIKMNENTYRIEDGGVRFFLLEGSEKALLIDTGMNTPNAKEIAESITNLPLMLLNTHADPDHISGNDAFSEFYMNPNEEGNLLDHGKSGKIIPACDGDVIDLGGRKLRIIELFGHTEGSIAVLDIDAKILFGGDSIQDGRIFMFGRRRNIDEYIRSLKSLYENHIDGFDEVYPSHSSVPVSPELIPKLIEAAEKIAAKDAVGQETDFFGQKIMYYDFGFAGFLCDI